MLPAAIVKVRGRPLAPEQASHLLEVRVDSHLRLPDAAVVRLADPELEHVDGGPFEVGAPIEIGLLGAEDRTATTVFEGQIVALEPEFAPSGSVLAARAYDGAHALHRSKRTQTYQDMTPDDIARQVARRARLDTGVIEAAGAPRPFEQQTEETDLEFLWRLAARVDFEVVVQGRRLHFRRAGGEADGGRVALRWGERLLSFRPRVTGVQQVGEVTVRGWDPTAAQAIVATAPVGPSDADIGIEREAVSSGLGGGTMTVADRPVTSQGEADALARSVAAHLANGYVEAEGVCQGDPRLRAGARISVDGVGTRFGGTYVLSSVTHSYRGRRGYQTAFSVSGRSPRSLVDLVTPAPQRSWGGGLVVGVVTQNEHDPERLGRVRVRYPPLGDDTEGWWARVASVGAGEGRGLAALPLVGDEVVLAFEHGDVRRPYVLGALWNGRAAPGAELTRADGSLDLRSKAEVTVGATGAVTITSGADLEVTTDGATRQTAKGDLAVEGRQVTVKGTGGVTIEAGTDLTVKGASVTVEATGVLRVKGAQVMLG